MLYYLELLRDKCFKKEKEEIDELIILVNDLLKTQREILKYVEYQEQEIKKLKSGWGRM